ncbi:alpha/beta hydrolase [Mycobacterium sp. 3519A]|uniref:alpha/beta hydrolase n=1 Tax=Mycobacterium sp. 3519A TaxID=2057184 RepID=UPI000C7DB5D2|nr:alpha/beta fold hydrolase [Mycobacterium sp. 3519A]
MLEVIDRGGEGHTRRHPLVLVHGAWHANWCWEDNFVDFFVDRGFRVLAPSLRGHGKSALGKPLRLCSIRDYVTDVAAVVETLPSPPILVGHSIGGFVVQKYLESHEAPAAVLMASTPPRGGQLGSLFRSIRRHPWRSTKFALTAQPRHLCGSPAGVRELFFGADVPASLVDAFATRIQPDSTRAMMFDTVVGDLVDTKKIHTQMLVVGGECDQVYPPRHVRRTAAAYGTQPVLFPGAGHELMLEPQWRAVAGYIETWLADRGF